MRQYLSFDDRRTLRCRTSFLAYILLLSALGSFPPRTAGAGPGEGARFQDMLVDLRFVTTLTNGSQVFHPEGHMTGIRVAQPGLVLCPSFVQRAQPLLLGGGGISLVRYYAACDGENREARILYGGADICLLDLGPGLSGPFLPAEALTRGTVAAYHLRLVRTGPRGMRTAIVHACRDVGNEREEPPWIVPGCTLTRDWLGALCLSIEGEQIVGILSAFSCSPQDNSIYNFSLNAVPLDIVPDAVVTPLDANDLRLLLQNPRLLQLSQLEWMGMKYTKEEEPQDALHPRRWRVRALPSGSLGARCGLQVGDLIIRINEKMVTARDDYSLFLTADHAAGRTPVRLTFLRANEQKECAVLIPDWADSAPILLEGLGITVEQVCSSQEGRDEFRVLDTTEATLRCIPGLRIGDIIQRLNGKEFQRAGEVQQYVGAAHGELVVELLRAGKRTVIVGEKP